jgi:aminoglycoside phosphotransferase (APT) family kinase protein
LPASGRPVFTAQDELAVVRRWSRSIAWLIPDLAQQSQTIADGLSAMNVLAGSVPQATIHRDFYEKQLILSPNHVTLLDLDTLAGGDPAVDLGNFLAHTLLREVTARGSGEFLGVLARRFLEGYQSRRGPVSRSHLAFYLATSLFRLGAVHALRSKTARHRGTLWSAAEKCLSRGEYDPGILMDAARLGAGKLDSIGQCP